MTQKNIEQDNLIVELKKLAINEDIKFWKRIATELEKPTRNRRVVNISKLNKVTKDGETIIIPGKVLGSGDLNHKLTVCAHLFSGNAKSKISQKGKVLSVSELMKQNPKAKGVRIIG